MLKDLIVGTSNAAKKKSIQSALTPLGITVRGTDDLGIFIDVPEDGKTAQENARKKSVAYAQAAGQLVLSMDNALYLAGLADDAQPGIHTRRIPGKTSRVTDRVLLLHYAHIIKELGGTVNGHWEYALCMADAQGRVVEADFISPRIFVSEPCASQLPGYPLESLQIEPESGKYIAEMTEEEQAAFWQRGIGEFLMNFVREAEAFFAIKA